LKIKLLPSDEQKQLIINTMKEVDTIDADYNAAHNIASLGISINNPESTSMFCSLHNILSSKTHTSLVCVGSLLEDIKKHYDNSRENYKVQGESHFDYYRDKYPDNYLILMTDAGGKLQR
jgi:hypothetical protein